MQNYVRMSSQPSFLKKMLSGFLLGLIKAYQLLVSPVIHVFSGPNAGCRFHPNCSEYAIGCIKSKGPLAAIRLIFKRLLKCHPGNPGGNDPVPDQDI